MIDWLNFWIGIVFSLAGISILFSSSKHYIIASSDKFFNITTFIGVAFLASGQLFIFYSPISFDSALHECTEWRVKAIPLTEEDDTNACTNITSSALIHLAGEYYIECSECVSFREKTQAELDADYCRENPTDTTRCYCLEYNAFNKVSNRSEVEQKCGGIDDNIASEFCVSAVPISEKLYCNENPNDYGKCNCKEEKTEVERYDFVEMHKTFQNEQDYFDWSEQGRYSFSVIYTFVDGASGLIQIPVEEQPDLIDYLLDFKTKVHDIQVRYYEKIPINITTCVGAVPKLIENG